MVGINLEGELCGKGRELRSMVGVAGLGGNCGASPSKVYPPMVDALVSSTSLTRGLRVCFLFFLFFAFGFVLSSGPFIFSRFFLLLRTSRVTLATSGRARVGFRLSGRVGGRGGGEGIRP